MNTGAALKINLGSGQRKFGEGWTNVDCQEKWKPDVLAHGDSMPMFADGSASMIVAHHVIEHVGLGEFDQTLRECWRVLEPGGSLIVTTPDMDALTRAYVRRVMPSGAPFEDYLFCVNLYGAYIEDEADRHKWLYNARSLSAAVYRLQLFNLVKTFDWRQLDGADIARDWWILGIEAVK